MMNDLKLGMKILRYGYGLKSNCVLAVVCLAMGIGFYLLGAAAAGSVMFLCVGMVPVQILQSLNMANLVQASPSKKRMQTSVAAVLCCAAMLALYLAVALAGGVMALGRPRLLGQVCASLIVLGLYSVIIMLFTGIVYKYFVAASLVFIPIMVCGIQGTEMSGIFREEIFVGQGAAAFCAAAVLGALLVVLGGFIQYLTSLLCYKAPMSKMAQMAPLRKSL